MTLFSQSLVSSASDFPSTENMQFMLLIYHSCHVRSTQFSPCFLHFTGGFPSHIGFKFLRVKSMTTWQNHMYKHNDTAKNTIEHVSIFYCYSIYRITMEFLVLKLMAKKAQEWTTQFFVEANTVGLPSLTGIQISKSLDILRFESFIYSHRTGVISFLWRVERLSEKSFH